MPSVRIIGPGRAGSSLAEALRLAGWAVYEPVPRGADVIDAAQGVDLCVVATPDAVIADVAAAIRPSASAVVAHMSGSLGIDVLPTHARRAAIHPLASLPDRSTGCATLRSGVWWAVEGDPLAYRLVDDLGGRRLEVPSASRAVYHAAACIAANHLVAVLAQVERVAATAGLPLEPFYELAASTLANARARGAAAALTGPAARGDASTLDRHRGALSAGERGLYDALAGAARGRRLPSERGGGVQVIDSIPAWRKSLDAERSRGRRVGLVPTMGALHAGHASLVAAAAADCDAVGVTVFVNPRQFGANEDLDAYPRTLAADVAVAEAAGATHVFAPAVGEMYPAGAATTVTVGGISSRWEGESRPGHFDGVATVVTKLFAQAGPCRAYFGEKDYQQLCVIRRLAHDLDLPVDVVGCPTVREPDGLALSSRNAYLTTAERPAASVLHRALLAGAAQLAIGEPPKAAEEAMRRTIAAEPAVALVYAAAVDPDTLESLTRPLAPGTAGRALIAARLGRTRLIDNIGVSR